MPEKPRLTKAAVAKALKAARDKRGADYVYSFHPCVYVEYEDGQPKPSCLVGEVLVSGFGIEPEALASCDMTADGALELLAADGVLTYTEKAKRVLVVAQLAQDSQATWGDAVAEALSV